MKLTDFRTALNAAFDKLEADNPGISDVVEVVSWTRDNSGLTTRNIEGLLREPQELIQLIEASQSLIRGLPEGYTQPHVVSIEI